MNFDVAMTSEIGPRSANEDKAGFWSPREGALVAAIADGLGGMGGGQHASQIALDTFHRLFAERVGSESDLREAAEEAHREILAAQREDANLHRMASTLTGVILFEGSLVGVHCGDTRAAIARGEGIRKLTVDQSEGERLFQSGKLTKEELRNYPRKNILESALGSHDGLTIDTFNFPVQSGDKVLLTSDGAHEKLLLREMLLISKRHTNVNNFIDEMRVEINRRKPEDNFSVVAIFVN